MYQFSFDGGLYNTEENFLLMYRGWGNISYIHAQMGSQVPLKESYRTANCIISHTARRHRVDGNFTKHLNSFFLWEAAWGMTLVVGWSIVVILC